MTLPPAALHPAAALLFIVIGLLLRLGGLPDAGRLVWTGGLVLTGAPVVWRTLRGIASGRFAADLVAMLAIVAALLLGQPLAGLIVVLMQTGGEALERYAEGRASEAVRALEAAAPRTAYRVSDGRSEEVPVDAVAVGDELLIRPGDMRSQPGKIASAAPLTANTRRPPLSSSALPRRRAKSKGFRSSTSYPASSSRSSSAQRQIAWSVGFSAPRGRPRPSTPARAPTRSTSALSSPATSR